jgi:hypothetical protein
MLSMRCLSEFTGKTGHQEEELRERLGLEGQVEKEAKL